MELIAYCTNLYICAIKFLISKYKSEQSELLLRTPELAIVLWDQRQIGSNFKGRRLRVRPERQRGLSCLPGMVVLADFGLVRIMSIILYLLHKVIRVYQHITFTTPDLLPHCSLSVKYADKQSESSLKSCSALWVGSTVCFDVLVQSYYNRHNAHYLYVFRFYAYPMRALDYKGEECNRYLLLKLI